MRVVGTQEKERERFGTKAGGWWIIQVKNEKDLRKREVGSV